MGIRKIIDAKFGIEGERNRQDILRRIVRLDVLHVETRPAPAARLRRPVSRREDRLHAERLRKKFDSRY